ncbi:Mannan polymerase complexes subunit MNN9 [Erysiphe necator]|nr:Mannan polymerase complexes subunit MNN9 [Erysiphe necator]
MGPVRRERRTHTLIFYLGIVVCIFILLFLFSPSSEKHSIPISSTAGSGTKSSPSRYLSFNGHKNKSDRKRKTPPILHYYMNNVTTSNDPIGKKETILILTPIARFYQEYWDNLLRLSYPRDLITLGFIIPKNREGNIAMAALQEQIKKTQNSESVKDKFKSIIIERENFDTTLIPQSKSEHQSIESRKAQRAALSRARNTILFTTLNPAISWVLWLDADITETPPSLIQDLASHNKPIVAPNCFQRYHEPDTNRLVERPHNLNNWQETEMSRRLGEKIGPDVLLESYTEITTHRTFMAYMATENGDPKFQVLLDGVGANVLLVKAEVHRDGAIFPPFVFYHLIEAEGFAKMAMRLGWHAIGLPNYKVYHHHHQ